MFILRCGRVPRRLVSRQVILVTCATLAAIPFQAPAEDTMEPSLRGEDRVISLPYGFWTETFGLAAAYVYGVNGYPQPQAGLNQPWPIDLKPLIEP